MEIRKLALIHKEGIKPPYYIKKGDNVEFFLFNEDGSIVRFDMESRNQLIEDEEHIEFYKGNRAGNRDFFRLVKDEDSKR